MIFNIIIHMSGKNRYINMHYQHDNMHQCHYSISDVVGA